MTIHWDALLAVFVVSLASAVTIVALVALALRAFSPSTTVAEPAAGPRRRPVAATAVAASCLTLAATIVLAGLWVIVAK